MIRACNQTEDLEEFIDFDLITRRRINAYGKHKTIDAIIQRKCTGFIVDDNCEMSNECQIYIHSNHLKLRRKPVANGARVVKNLLEECFEPVADEILKHLPQFRNRDR